MGLVMYRVLFTKQAQRQLERAPRIVSERVRAKLRTIAEAPYETHNNVTKLQNRPGYRLRVGDWRVIYELYDGELVILIVKIAPRGEAYR